MKFPARIFVFASILVLLFLLVPFSSYAAEPGSVVINEVLYDPSGTDTGLEWIELYNKGSDPVDLTNYDLDPSDVKYFTFPSFVIGPGAFVVIHINATGTNTATDLYDGGSSNMSNTKGPIALFSSTTHSASTLVDYIEYGAGGQTNESKAVSAGIWTASDFVPDVGEGSSIGLKVDGEDNNSSSDWQEFTVPTPGSGNIAGGDEEEEKEATYSAQIFLNEIMPNPVGDDENEYLELYNASDGEVDVKDWVLRDLTGDRIIGPEASPSSTLIPAKGFLVIYKKDGSVSLNNDGDTISILNPNAETVDEVAYPEIKEGWVYQRYPDGASNWSESNEPTARAANKPSSSNSSNSSDPEVIFSVVGESFKVNQSFDVKVEIKNAKPLHDYYVKVRLGLEESKLTKGRTYNGFLKDWFADNSVWKNFPVVYTDGDGRETIALSAKVASGNPAGTYIIGVRMRDKETEDNYDSETQTIEVGEEPPEAVVEEDENSDDSGSVLGTLTELPATGAGTIGLGYLGLSLGLFLRIIAESYILVCDRMWE